MSSLSRGISFKLFATSLSALPFFEVMSVLSFFWTFSLISFFWTKKDFEQSVFTQVSITAVDVQLPIYKNLYDREEASADSEILPKQSLHCLHVIRL